MMNNQPEVSDYVHLLNHLHVCAIYLACIFHQGQKGAPLSEYEIASCHAEVCDIENIYERCASPEQILRHMEDSILKRWQPKD